MFESIRANQRHRKLIRCWIRYRDMIQRFEGAEDATESHEKRFLGLKAELAGLLPTLENRAPGSVARDVQRRIMLMTDLLNRHRSLRPEEPPTEKEREEFAKTWHDHYIFMNQLRGAPVASQKRVSPQRPQQPPTGMPGPKIRRTPPVGRFLGFAVRAGVIGLVVYLLGRAFGVRWDEAKGFEIDSPTSVNGVGENVWQGLRTIWIEIVDFLQPVTGTYGLEASITLVGVLLIALGYWFFIRGR